MPSQQVKAENYLQSEVLTLDGVLSVLPTFDRQFSTRL